MVNAFETLLISTDPSTGSNLLRKPRLEQGETPRAEPECAQGQETQYQKVKGCWQSLVIEDFLVAGDEKRHGICHHELPHRARNALNVVDDRREPEKQHHEYIHEMTHVAVENGQRRNNIAQPKSEDRVQKQ